MNFWTKRHIKKDDRGGVAIEFGILFPSLLIILIGMFDVSNLIYCYNKMNQTAQDISNIVTRGNLTKPQLDGLLQVSKLTAQPFKFSLYGNIIVTSVSKQNAAQPPQVMWRDSYPGTTTGSLINPTNLPGGLVLSTGQTVIFTEVFFSYTPTVPGLVLPSTQLVYSFAAAMPRLGQMTTLPAS